ncbi:hypothetical protein [Kitasatospora sp. NPDC091207]|uniref:hypothetical protein n=1 Tax=Kitasatospora sp. NPDC091207 TaxID=3364083 RepID=UPI00380D5A4D
MAALMAAAMAGRVGRRPGGLVVLQEWFDEPLLLGTSILVLLFVALVFVPWRIWIRSVLGTVVLTLGLGTVPLWIFADDPVTTRTEAAPGRTDRRLVVKEGAALIDPLWWVYVDEGAGLGTRRWPVAFVNGDWNSLREISWAGPDQLRLVTDHESHLIRVRADGRPERTVVDAF